MNKKSIRIISVLLLLALTLMPGLTVFAEGEDTSVPEADITITSLSEFLEFADSCQLDSFSQDLVVLLDTDLDLTGSEFAGIPIFSGTFLGNHHTISGLSLTADGSQQGLFRYLSDTAHVQDLTVTGALAPEGSQASVGGIAGSNAGTIENCTFKGSISGGDRVGGVAGTNRVSGVIDGCHMYGSVQGMHFVGGIAGENSGVIRSSNNSALINTESTENQLSLSHVTIGTITGTESARTVTDIGGIAGTSGGVIRQCINYGPVGYPHMGYNLGGIAGSQKGYITECTNYADICGRKEVGGIVGQMEPVSKVEYSQDTLQILQGQLANTSAMIHQASIDTRNSVDSIQQQFGALRDQAQIASDAVDILTPHLGEPLPDYDSAVAAKNALSSSVQGMHSAVSGISSATQSAGQQVTQNMMAISQNIQSIASTVQGASENIGGTITDISDEDTDEDLMGKVSNSVNFGKLDGDLNIGGIAGAIAIENDLDPEDDLQFSGNMSLNFEGELRAVIINCENKANLSCKRRNAGGIAGRQALGLVKDCINTGSVTTDGGDYVGGIAGTSNGFIRACSSKAVLSGAVYVGGIAGNAVTVTDCRSLSFIEDSKEKAGAVIGCLDQDTLRDGSEISGNYYVPGNQELGAIDNISYQDAAQPMELEAFLQLESLPSIFGTSTITFLEENGVNRSFEVPLGGAFSEEEIPAVPEKEGHTGIWEDLSQADLNTIYFDQVFKASYTPYQTTIESQETRVDGKPLLLAQGHFRDMDHFSITPLEQLPDLGKGQSLEGWSLPVFSEDGATPLRLACPTDEKPQNLSIFLRSQDGTWRETETQVNGSYLSFQFEATDDAICVVRTQSVPYWIFLVAAGVILVIAVPVIVTLRRKKAKQSSTKKA